RPLRWIAAVAAGARGPKGSSHRRAAAEESLRTIQPTANCDLLWGLFLLRLGKAWPDPGGDEGRRQRQKGTTVSIIDDEPRWLITPEEAKARALAQAKPPVVAKTKQRSRISGKLRLFNRFWTHPQTPGLSHAAQATWTYLWGRADKRRTCYPPIGRIAARLG